MSRNKDAEEIRLAMKSLGHERYLVAIPGNKKVRLIRNRFGIVGEMAIIARMTRELYEFMNNDEDDGE